jgi:hypothetical protein
MLDRLFGRNKDDNQEPTCAACGRTLLPGEWAQTVIADDGREEIICSLCAQSGVADSPAAPIPEPLGEVGAPIPVSGRPQPLKPRQGRESHDESDAFWRALKEKDAEIERLRAEAARADAERQELVAQLSLLQRQLNGEAVTDWQAAAPFAGPAVSAAVPEVAAQPADIPLQQTEEYSAEEAAAVEERAEQPIVAEPEALEAEEAPQVAAAEDVEPPVAQESEPPLAQEPEPREAPSPGDTAEMTSPGFQPQPGEVDADPVVAAGRPAGEQDDDVTEGVPLPPAVMPGGSLSTEEGPSWLFDAPPHQTFGDTAMPPEMRQAVEAREAAALEDARAQSYRDSAPTQAAPLFAPPTAVDPGVSAVFGEEPAAPAPEAPEAPVYTPEELAAEAETLMLLQRGADLLNVSPAPRKIAETSESLGVPMVHLSSDGQTMNAVLLWSMAWYEYQVDLSTGEVGLAERGYDDRPDLQPNAKVRADGTVQIAPPTRRPPGSRPVAPPPAAPPAGPIEPPVDPGARPAAPGNADIISKSLKGQRTDDEAVAWDQMAARDFDWGQ